MSGYLLAKWVHVAAVTLSIAGFITRYRLASRGSRLLWHPLARVAPHVNDTVLLGAAIVMLILAGINPLAVPWLGAKIVGLLAYIVLGMVALRRGRTPAIRAAAFYAALACFAYVVSVAVVKSPLGILAALHR